MSGYRVNLDIFAGPLDLLLYLVRKEEVDIYDISIAHITEQYVKYIELLKALDVDMVGDFLVMAATLMEIKSAMLLPRSELEDDAEQEFIDPRADLIRQLLEYKRFKDAANVLEGSAQERKQRFTRPDAIVAKLNEAQDEPELDLDQISIWTLLEAFDNIMQATGRLANFDHIKDDTPIDLYQIEILHRLQEEGPMAFETIFRDKANRLTMIGLFLALLELVRSELIRAEQPEKTDTIFLRAMTEEPAEQAVQNAIISNIEPDEPEPAPVSIKEIPQEPQPAVQETQEAITQQEPPVV